MRVAITGCDGFIGKYLTQKLEQTSNEIIKIDFDYGYNITDPTTLETLPEFDVLVHLAAKSFVPDSYKLPHKFYNVNVMGTINALELCRKFNAKMVFTSSYVYGHPQYQPIDEEHPVAAFNPYSQTKIIGEQLCRGYNRDFHTDAVIIRPFNIFGYGQNENFLIPQILHQAKDGKVQLKDPAPKRDYIYIKDLIDGFDKAIHFQSDTVETFNLASGISYSIQDITDIICSEMPGKVKIEFDNQKRINEVNDTIANIDKANEVLNWSPKFSFREGIMDYLEMEKATKIF